MICLATPRLLLRTWRPEDRSPLEALLVGSVPSFGIVGLRHLGGVSEATALLERFEQAWALDGHGLFAVEALETGMLLGVAGLQPGDRARSTLELVWQVATLADPGSVGGSPDGPALDGEETAIEAVAAVIDWAFGLFDVEVVEATVGLDDRAAAGVAEAVGMSASEPKVNPLTNERTVRFTVTRAVWSAGDP